jgi:hypothetical protein
MDTLLARAFLRKALNLENRPGEPARSRFIENARENRAEDAEKFRMSGEIVRGKLAAAMLKSAAAEGAKPSHDSHRNS